MVAIWNNLLFICDHHTNNFLFVCDRYMGILFFDVITWKYLFYVIVIFTELICTFDPHMRSRPCVVIII